MKAHVTRSSSDQLKHLLITLAPVRFMGPITEEQLTILSNSLLRRNSSIIPVHYRVIA